MAEFENAGVTLGELTSAIERKQAELASLGGGDSGDGPSSSSAAVARPSSVEGEGALAALRAELAAKDEELESVKKDMFVLEKDLFAAQVGGGLRDETNECVNGCGILLAVPQSSSLSTINFEL